MIIIEKPEIIKNEKEVILSSNFSIKGEQRSLWYKFPLQYEKFLVTENLDASFVGLLFLGLKTGYDIKLNGPVSSRLLYSVNHNLITALCRANSDFKKINIFADTVNNEDLNIADSAGTGFSCGVDSFATYFSHAREEGAFELKFLTFFNVGSHGDFGGEKSRRLYEKRLKSIYKFAEKEGKEVISIDSNLSENLRMNFQQTNTFRSVSCVLNLQKLFRNYYYASSFPIDQFNLSPVDTSYYDILNLSMLSTESTNFFSSDIFWSRIEKTNFISQFPLTYSFLDVCTNLKGGFSTKNCSSCEKCLRTALTLELFGKLELYKEVFDLKLIQKNKDQYIGKLLATRNANIFNRELLDLLKNRNVIRLIHYGYFTRHKSRIFKKRIKKFIKNKVNRS